MNSLSYSVGFVVLMVASMLVVAQKTDPCVGIKDCKTCVTTKIGSNNTCVYKYTTATAPECVSNDLPAEGDHEITNATECVDPPTTTAPPETTTVNGTTTSTTTAAPTNATTPTPAPTPTTAPTNATTPAPPTTPTTPNSTTPVPPTTPTPVGPTNGTVPTTPSPTPVPHSGGGMSVASFFGGIVFTLCVSAVGYLVWRFYKARLDRNYHTLSTNLI